MSISLFAAVSKSVQQSLARSKIKINAETKKTHRYSHAHKNEFNLQSLSTITWSFTTLGVRDDALFAAVADFFSSDHKNSQKNGKTEKIQRAQNTQKTHNTTKNNVPVLMKSEPAVNLVWAFTKAGKTPPAAILAFVLSPSCGNNRNAISGFGRAQHMEVLHAARGVKPTDSKLNATPDYSIAPASMFAPPTSDFSDESFSYWRERDRVTDSSSKVTLPLRRATVTTTRASKTRRSGQFARLSRNFAKTDLSLVAALQSKETKV